MSAREDLPVFSRVAPADVGKMWDFVERGLLKIIERCPTVPWTPRDVRRHLRQERAALYAREDGFIVIQRCAESISGEPYLNVWLMWFESGAAVRLRHELLDWLDEACRATGCEWWEFTSTREDWGAALADVCEAPRTSWVRRVK